MSAEVVFTSFLFISVTHLSLDSWPGVCACVRGGVRRPLRRYHRSVRKTKLTTGERKRMSEDFTAEGWGYLREKSMMQLSVPNRPAATGLEGVGGVHNSISPLTVHNEDCCFRWSTVLSSESSEGFIRCTSVCETEDTHFQNKCAATRGPLSMFLIPGYMKGTVQASHQQNCYSISISSQQ